ncbi:hypothetical protein A8M32_00985 [Sinorhizobium alkalisoli]|uniref:Nodulation protein NopC n=1 Tax=Sinorhizobium alkalisoli TaxID=1752398 RepID=A0A1E3VHZ2_9HYPH|nr:hypothetical protein A8M32_00985 [Sinorhizobium alkalisoli]
MVAVNGSFGSFGAFLARTGGHERSNRHQSHVPDHKKPADPNTQPDPKRSERGHGRTDIPPKSGDGSQAASQQEAFQLALNAVALTIMNDVMADAEEAMAETEEDT